MLLSTTFQIEGKNITEYHGLVFGESVQGIDFIKDLGAGFRNLVGGRSVGYEEEMLKARNDVLKEMIERAENMGANGIIGISFDFTSMGQGNMLMVNATGTAVTLE